MSKLKNRSVSNSNRDKLNYIVCACLYCWHLWVSKVGRRIQKGVFILQRLFVLIFLPKRYLNKFYRNYISGKKAIDPMYWDLDYGHHIRIAKNLVYDTCYGYVAFPVAAVSSIICSLIGWDNIFRWKAGIGIFVIIIVMVLTMYVGVVRLTSVFDDPHVYLSYFKEFQKQGGDWLKKWKIYTILLFGGAILSAVMSLGLYFLCIYICRNINGPFI